MHLTRARRAFLKAATVHPIYRRPSGVWECADVAVAHATGRALERAGLIYPVMQGEFVAEEWGDRGFVGWRYQRTTIEERTT